MATFAFITPTLLSWGVLGVAVHKNRFWPWRLARAFPAESEKQKLLQAGSNSNLWPSIGSSGAALNLVRAELSVYLLCLVFSSVVLSWCLAHLSWNVVIRPDQNWILNGLIPRAIDFLIAFSLGLPLLWFGQLKVLHAATGRTIRNTLWTSEFLFTASLFSTLLLVGLPLVQWFLIKCGVSGESYYFMRDLFRFSFAFSAIPLSIALLTAALHGESFPTKEFRRASKFLDKNDLSTLAEKTEEELHYLVDVALKSSKIEVADKISQQLLRRAESY